MRFNNPWSKTVNFVDLGVYDISTRVSVYEDTPVHDDERQCSLCDIKNKLYDLYAITSYDKITNIDFGARFSDAPEDYVSGEASFVNGKWVITANGPVAVAAAKYFANHHEDKNGEILKLQGKINDLTDRLKTSKENCEYRARLIKEMREYINQKTRIYL